MILQITEATEITKQVITENLATGIALLGAGFMGFIITRMIKDREDMRASWLRVLEKREEQIAAKDVIMEQMRKEDRVFVEKTTSALTKFESSMEAINRKLLQT